MCPEGSPHNEANSRTVGFFCWEKKPFPNVSLQGLTVQMPWLISTVDPVFVGRGSLWGTGRFKSQGDLETKAWIAPGNELKIGAACVPSALHGLCLKCGYVSRQLHIAISWSFWVVLRRSAEQTTWQRSSLEMRKAQTMVTQSNRTRGWNLLTKQIGEGEINTRISCCHWNIQKHLEIQEVFSSWSKKGKASLHPDSKHHFCHLPQLFPATIIILILYTVSSCLLSPGFGLSLRKPNICRNLKSHETGVTELNIMSILMVLFSSTVMVPLWVSQAFCGKSNEITLW